MVPARTLGAIADRTWLPASELPRRPDLPAERWGFDRRDRTVCLSKHKRSRLRGAVTNTCKRVFVLSSLQATLEADELEAVGLRTCFASLYVERM